MVKICTGTLCYVMGGAELQLLDEYLPSDLSERVDIIGTPCLDCCTSGEGSNAPYVEVGGKIVPEASLGKLVDIIREELKG